MFDLNKLYKIRKELHKIPEIAFKEQKTQELILDEFANRKELTLTRFSPTGLLYEYAKGEGEYIIFRADMDALPINEKTNCGFMSTHPGFFHACGHDVHMTVLIGLMHYVLDNKIPLNILFLFQPAEEGYGGAEHIIKTGIFDNYQVKAAFALHVSGQYPTGSIGIKSGIMLGIPQEFDVEFYGKSSHVATPHKGKDAFLVAMSFYQAIKNIISTRFPAQEPIIFHIGKVNAGTVRNIIPDYCKLEGTFRCLKKEIHDNILDILQKTVIAYEKSYDIKIKLTKFSSYDPVVNDASLTDDFIKILPEDIVVQKAEHSMTGEDFGFFTSMYPSVFFWLGTDSKEDLHSNSFLPDEKSIGVALRIYKNLLDHLCTTST